MSLYKRIDVYFLRPRGPNEPPTRRQDERARVRIPAKVIFGLGKNTWLLATCSWTNMLLPLIPIALALPEGLWGSSKAFWLSYWALLSAFGLFRYGSEELSIPAQRTFGILWDILEGVLSLDFEIIVVALYYGYLELAKAYIVGKIVSTTLLTLGLCFTLAGMRRAESHFNITVASLITSMLATAVVPFGILALFPSGFDGDLTSAPVLTFSRAASFVLLTLFLIYQYFRRTHTLSYDYEDNDSEPSEDPHSRKCIKRAGQLNTVFAIGVMLAAAVVAYFCSLPILSASSTKGVPPKTFTGFCLLPILAEVAEIPLFVRLVHRDQMDIAVAAAAGTSVQTALYIAPILCLLGWALGQPMSLSLNLLEVVSFGVSVWIFNYAIQDGKSNWMEGAMSLGLYLVQAGAFYLYGRR